MADTWRMVLNIPKLRGRQNWYSWMDDLSTILRNQESDLWAYAEGTILFPTKLTELSRSNTMISRVDGPPSPISPDSPESYGSEGSFDSAIDLSGPPMELSPSTNNNPQPGNSHGHGRKHSWASKLNSILSPKPRQHGHKRSQSAISALSTSPSMYLERGLQSPEAKKSSSLTPTQLAWLKADKFVASALHLTCAPDVQQLLTLGRASTDESFQTAADLFDSLRARFGPSADPYACWLGLVHLRRHAFPGYWEFANAFRDAVRACREAGTQLGEELAAMQFLAALDDGAHGFVWQRAKAVAGMGRGLDEIVGETGKAVAEAQANVTVGVSKRASVVRRSAYG